MFVMKLTKWRTKNTNKQKAFKIDYNKTMKEK